MIALWTLVSSLWGPGAWLRWLLIAGFLAGIAGIYGKGWLDAQARCNARELEAELRRVKVSLQLERMAAGFQARAASEMAAEADQAEKTINDYRNELARSRAAAAAEKAALKARLWDQAGNAEMLHAEIQKLLARPDQCRLDDRDVALDRRLLRASKPRP